VSRKAKGNAVDGQLQLDYVRGADVCEGEQPIGPDWSGIERYIADLRAAPAEAQRRAEGLEFTLQRRRQAARRAAAAAGGTGAGATAADFAGGGPS
jgi:hypothetical protein